MRNIVLAMILLCSCTAVAQMSDQREYAAGDAAGPVPTKEMCLSDISLWNAEQAHWRVQKVLGQWPVCVAAFETLHRKLPVLDVTAKNVDNPQTMRMLRNVNWNGCVPTCQRTALDTSKQFALHSRLFPNASSSPENKLGNSLVIRYR